MKPKNILSPLLAATLFALLFVVAPRAAARRAAAQTPTVYIGAWNIQWLGSPSQRPSYATGVAQSAADLADYIKRSKVDVLGLEEITDDDGAAGTRTNKTLTAAFDLIRQDTGQQWNHFLFPKPGTDQTQLVGLAWNRGKVNGDPQVFPIALDLPPGAGEVWRRWPYAVKLSFGNGKTDVVVIVVHMKSNRTGDGCDADCVRCARASEAFLLAAELDEISQKFQDADIVILGDTNVLSRNEPAVRTLTGAGLRDLNSQDNATFYDGAPFDRIFVTGGQPEFNTSSMGVYDNAYLTARGITKEQFWRRYSDHFMVVTGVSVMNDDD